jgi:hypothetical protein
MTENRNRAPVVRGTLVPENPSPGTRRVAGKDVARRDHEVDLEVVLGRGQRLVEHLQWMDRGSDARVRSEQPGILEQRDLQVGVAGALTDALASAVDRDAAADDEVDRLQLVDRELRGTVRGSADGVSGTALTT